MMHTKKNLGLLFDKLLFKDISAGSDQQTPKKFRRQRQLALAAIAVVLVAGLVLTTGYTLTYYNMLKDNFFAEPEPIKELGTFDPSAVWFSQEIGNPYLIQGIIAYLNHYEDDRLTLDIVNVNDIPVELISVQDKDGKYIYPFPDQTVLDPSENYVTRSFTLDGVQPAMMTVQSEIVVNYQYDDGVPREAIANPFMKNNEALFTNTRIRNTDNTSDFDNLVSDRNAFYFEGNHVQINQPLYIPQGKTLRVSAGQEIDLTDQAFILSRSPVSFEGTASKPIKIFSSDGSGRGFLVMQSQEPSTITYTIFDGLDAPKTGVWELTGAVTFYEADVEINNSQFINNISEDGLNTIRSDFKIHASYFGNTASDAFDADFCEGTISVSVFENTTNDAIDVSGSLIRIENTQTTNNGDKGISVGEKSTVELQNVSIDRAVVGIASKDLSAITGDDIVISNSRIALTLYIKKAEFGPAEIDINNVSITGNVDLEYLIQPSSSLTIDGRIIRPRSAAKETLLFEKMINGEPIQ